MKTLHIEKGYWIDTTTGHQEVIARHGSTSFIVHNFDENGNYTGASIRTDREILHSHHDMTGKMLDQVDFDDGLWYAVQKDRTDGWDKGSRDLDEAIEMAQEQREEHPDTLIAVIDDSTSNPVCINEITDF